MDIVVVAVSLPSRALRAAAGLVGAAEQVPGLVRRLDAVLSAVEALVPRVAEVTDKADTAITRIDVVRADAADVAGRVDALQGRATAMLGPVEPLARVAAGIDVGLVRRLVATADRLQPLLVSVTRLDEDVPEEVARLVRAALPLAQEFGTLMPLMRELQAAIPDVRKILDAVIRLEPVMTDMETRIAGLPGASRMFKRGEREIEAAAASDGAR